MHDKALILACAASGMAGVIVTAVYGGMGFAGGFTLGLKALIGAILGGIGTPAGAALAGFASRCSKCSGRRRCRWNSATSPSMPCSPWS